MIPYLTMPAIPRDVWLFLHDRAIPTPHAWRLAVDNGWERRCPMCRIAKRLNYFPIPNGFWGDMWVCDPCRTQKEKIRRQTAKLVRQGKIIPKPCFNCGAP